MGPEIQTEAWAEVTSKPGQPSSVEKHDDPTLSTKLDELSKKWQFREPKSECSIMTAKGELTYVGRFEEGVVIRLHDDQRQMVFLTKDMAERLGKSLIKRT
jgi:hypothetical protein